MRYRVAVVNFSSKPEVWEFENGDDWLEIGRDAAGNLNLNEMKDLYGASQGQTAIDDALRKAGELLDSSENSRRKAVILISDLQAFEEGEAFGKTMSDIEDAVDGLDSAAFFVLGIGDVILWEEIRGTWQALTSNRASVVRDDATTDLRSEVEDILCELAQCEPAETCSPTATSTPTETATSTPTATFTPTPSTAIPPDCSTPTDSPCGVKEQPPSTCNALQGGYSCVWIPVCAGMTTCSCTPTSTPGPIPTLTHTLDEIIPGSIPTHTHTLDEIIPEEHENSMELVLRNAVAIVTALIAAAGTGVAAYIQKSKSADVSVSKGRVERLWSASPSWLVAIVFSLVAFALMAAIYIYLKEKYKVSDLGIGLFLAAIAVIILVPIIYYSLRGDRGKTISPHATNHAESGPNVSGRDLQYAKLAGKNLRRANLRGTNLREADLARADLSKATLRGANLTKADLCWADLSEADLRRSNLFGANLRGADLRGADLIRADLRGADLRGADLSRVQLLGANLREALLSRADLSGAELYEADFNEADLSQAILTRARYNSATRWPEGFDHKRVGAVGPGADLRGADLREADLAAADLSGADLSKADLRRVDLRRIDLSEAILHETDLSEADLSKASLRGADLREADLSKANLSKADLYDADLSRADLAEADLRAAKLLEADLRGANLRWADLREARYNDETMLPDDFDPEAEGATLVDLGGIDAR